MTLSKSDDHHIISSLVGWPAPSVHFCSVSHACTGFKVEKLKENSLEDGMHWRLTDHLSKVVNQLINKLICILFWIQTIPHFITDLNRRTEDDSLEKPFTGDLWNEPICFRDQGEEPCFRSQHRNLEFTLVAFHLSNHHFLNNWSLCYQWTSYQIWSPEEWGTSVLDCPDLWG